MRRSGRLSDRELMKHQLVVTAGMTGIKTFSEWLQVFVEGQEVDKEM